MVIFWWDYWYDVCGWECGICCDVGVVFYDSEVLYWSGIGVYGYDDYCLYVVGGIGVFFYVGRDVFLFVEDDFGGRFLCFGVDSIWVRLRVVFVVFEICYECLLWVFWWC